MVTSIRNLVYCLFVADLCGVASGSVWAASIDIDDTNANGTITITANDFEFGLFLNGALVQQGINNPTTTSIDVATPLVLFEGTWSGFGAVPEAGTIYLIEAPAYTPSGPPPIVSDIFDYQIIPNASNGNATIVAKFESTDTFGPLPTGIDPASVFPKDGQAVVLNFPFLSVVIRSNAVPEPTSFVLASLGLAGISVLRCKK